MTQPFGSWASELSTRELTRGIKGFADLQAAAGHLFLLESRPEEAGRSTLLMLPKPAGDAAPDASAGDGLIELTPTPLNVRSRVHEYGGGAFLATDNAVFVINFADQNLHRIPLLHTPEGVEPGPPQALTSGDTSRRYADFALDTQHNRLIAVCEQHSESQAEPQNLLVAIDLANGNGTPQETVLHEGHDFYAEPRISPDGTTLAFIAWNHPHMPWDETLVLAGELSPDGLQQVRQLVGNANESIAQLLWHDNNQLGMASDRQGFWNRYSCDPGTQDNAQPLHTDDAEYASPAWVFGQRECVALSAEQLIATRQAADGVELVAINSTSNSHTRLNNSYAGYHALCILDQHIYCLADRIDGFACLLRVPLQGGSGEILLEAGSLKLPAVAIPEPLSVTNRSGQQTHAWFYPPTAHDAAQHSENDQRQELPPLLVLSHGGPTSSCSPALNLRIQYYTSRGWAVADVNYGGSTGFGRNYRERLRHNWGLVDVADCEDIAQSLAAAGRVDRQRMAIKGGSAGGYTTLAALTFGEVFAAGASHYGIGDLAALVADTHKFEARYVDGLVPPDQIAARSPINAVEQLSCPTIFFQGSDDAVVPPNQAQAMVAALNAKGLPVAYVEFAGEGHGFRQATNIQHAAAAEYQFFCSVFAIACPDKPVQLRIENFTSPTLQSTQPQ